MSATIRTELGYYDPRSGRWVTVREGPTVMADAQSLLVAMSLPPNGRTMHEALDNTINPAIGYDWPWDSAVVLSVTTADGTPVREGVVTIQVPGRDPVVAPLGDAPIPMPPAAQAKVFVQAPGYATGVWEGSVVGRTQVRIVLQPE